MKHIFTGSYNNFIKKTSKLNFIVSIVFVLVFSYFFISVNLNAEGLLAGMISNIFTFSGIFCAVLIAFIISKVFQIRNESRDIKINVLSLSNKVTDFRRICEKIFSNYDVWDAKTKSALDKKYSVLTYRHLHDDYQQNKPTELIQEYIDEKDLRGGDFYLALRDLVRVSNRNYNLELYSDYDQDINYSFEVISVWSGIGCANVFFYFLDHKYNSYKNSMLIDNLSDKEKKEIENLARKINKEKYQDKKFDRKLLVEIGNDFEIDIFPKLYNYLYELKQSFSKSLNYTLSMLIYIIVFGVFMPLFYPLFKDFLIIQKILVYLSTVIISLLFLNFIIDFRSILKREIQV
nr:hypothetical protein [Flavobacterium sp. ASV13]